MGADPLKAVAVFEFNKDVRQSFWTTLSRRTFRSLRNHFHGNVKKENSRNLFIEN